MKNEQPTHLDLFSGIGGFALAAQWAGFRTIGFCEIDKYCQKVLAKNFLRHTPSWRQLRQEQSQDDNQLERGNPPRQKATDSATDTPSADKIPIVANIFDLDGRDFYGVTLITGGFPCQPFSVAGKRRGAADDRHLWPEMLRVIKEARPTWMLGENVPGIIPMELDNVLSDLESIGYATRPFVIPACAVDARHKRDRLWIVGRRDRESESRSIRGVADSDRARSQGRNGTELSECSRQRAFRKSNSQLADSINDGSYRTRGDATEQGSDRQNNGLLERECIWQPEPAICGMADGLSYGLVRYAGRVATKVPNRVNKLKALGNSIVPQVAYEIMREIRKLC